MTNCSHTTITQYSTVEVITESVENATSICNNFHLLITEDNRIVIQVKNTNAIALTFIAFALLLFFYSCCWLNRYYFCNSSDYTGIPVVPVDSATTVQGVNHRRDCYTINIDRTNSPDPIETARRFDIDMESLPSYTIVSGLPSYDDALEQFRKAGIILQPPSVIKLFEDVGSSKTGENPDGGDNISLNSICTCGASQQNPTSSSLMPPVIELNPDHLALLSQKRLSLQIAINSSIRRSSRSGRVDLCREVNRSNLLRTHDIPQIHRSNSSSSLSNERNLLAQRLKNIQHRGSLY